MIDSGLQINHKLGIKTNRDLSWPREILEGYYFEKSNWYMLAKLLISFYDHKTADDSVLCLVKIDLNQIKGELKQLLEDLMPVLHEDRNLEVEWNAWLERAHRKLESSKGSG